MSYNYNNAIKLVEDQAAKAAQAATQFAQACNISAEDVKKIASDSLIKSFSLIMFSLWGHELTVMSALAIV